MARGFPGLPAMTQSTGLERLRILVDAGIALSSELSLDALLQRIVETAAELTGARYAALGVIDRSGQTLERFLTTGVDPETHAAIGDLPRGRGILGVLIREARTLRLHDLADDPRSVGFPRNHPPMKTFLGVPIVLRGVAYGNLYLTEKQGDVDFSDEDEEFTQLLAAQAAVAIENARLYESSLRWVRQLESINEIGNAMVSELELEPLLELVARRLRELVDARLVLIALPEADGLRVAAVAGEADDGVAGMLLERAGSKAGRVLDRARSERIDALVEDSEVDQQAARLLGVSSALYVPLVTRGKSVGVVIAHDRLGPVRTFTDEELRLAETLAARAAVAVDLSERVSRDAVAARARGTGAGACAAGARAPRRDGTGTHVHPARAEATRAVGVRRGDPRLDRRRARPRRLDAPGRTPARGRASPLGSRRLRSGDGRASDWWRRSASGRDSRSISRSSSPRSACPATSRRPSTGSSRRR